MEIPYTSPNQRVVVTHKTQSDKEHLYGVVNIEAVLAAMQNLSDRAFKLYARMNLHQNEFTYALSPAALNKETGLSALIKVTYNRVIKRTYITFGSR